jgi:hypothetical protein
VDRDRRDDVLRFVRPNGWQVVTNSAPSRSRSVRAAMWCSALVDGAIPVRARSGCGLIRKSPPRSLVP